MFGVLFCQTQVSCYLCSRINMNRIKKVTIQQIRNRK